MNLLKNALRKNVALASNIFPTLSMPHNFNTPKYHTLSKTMTYLKEFDCYRQSSLLTPVTIFTIPVCGFKFKDIVHKRCKDCYIVVKDRQRIVLCKTHGRHKQKQIMPKEKDTWIITHSTHGKVRPW